MRALITGVTGQDGRYLAPLLQSLNFEVYGLSRKSARNIDPEILQELQGVYLHTADHNDYLEIKRVIQSVNHHWIFNLSGQSSVRESFESLEKTLQANLYFVEKLLKAVIELGLQDSIRIYQASSSEMFGACQSSPQNEETSFNPISPYGSSKLSAHLLCQQYRNRENVFVSTGILFNHESPKRTNLFVSKKITETVAKISLGMSNELVLGDLSARRDWGHASDYVDAMVRILKYEKPEDFVISTGEAHSVLDFVKEAFKAVGMEGEEIHFLKSSEELIRKKDHSNLVGDATKAHKMLNWGPKVDFRMLVNDMIQYDLGRLSV